MTGTLHATIATAAALLSPSLAQLPGLVAAAHPGVAHTPILVLPDDQPARVLVGAGNGRTVAVRQGDKRSALLELGLGRKPRVVFRWAGGLAQPSVGTDAAGRAVAVLRPCAALSEGDPPRRCALSIVDLKTGAARALAGSEGAALGDLDRGRAVIVRQREPASSDERAPLLAASGAGRASTVLRSLDAVMREGTGDVRTDASGDEVTAIDVRGDRVAVTIRAGTETGGVSVLATTAATGEWQLLAASRFGEGGIGPRRFSAPTITATGIRAFFDGAGDLGSYAGRWSTDGQLLRKIAARTFGGPELLNSAGFTGDTLVTWSEGRCDEGLLCGVAGYGPIDLG